ncbi:hypothetical protein [Acetobacterium bakii]|uniref:Uncharacterized protein n=1 Tax=Acetobacterium bakii TaxID=52689 RepID=A0A0L6U106_9FIRM|nr:hypothetical protein [Acetobacterium bakii]KNZ42201.1 hypothetical protein AKG39_07865 [Acetobacterium bakii]
MENQMNKTYRMDGIAIIIAMIVLWAVLIFVMLKIGDITPNQPLKAMIFTIGILVGVFATASSMAVLIHLKKNKKTLYVSEMTEKR